MSKILIIRLTSLGDVIFTIPLACTLKEEGNQIGWLVSEKGSDIIKDNPCVDKYHFFPLEKFKKNPLSLNNLKIFFNLINELRAEKYDIAIDCQQMFKSLFLFMLCGAKRRITYEYARELSFLGGNEFVLEKANFRDFNYHIVERNLDFARYLGIEPKQIKFSLPKVAEDSKNKVNNLLKDLVNSKPLVTISPATTWENKHWAEENWADLIDALSDKCNFVFTGNEKDKSLIERILSKTKKELTYTNLVGETNLEELREVFSGSKLVISPDSGSAHLAWATNVPSVIAIFTCTPPKRFGPYGNSEKYHAISFNLSCQPCFKRKCHLKTSKNKCQNYPTSEEIINIVNNIMQ